MAHATAERLHNLPAQPLRLIGRDDAVAATRQLLLEGASGIVTLTGAGGCGKALLAVHVAADLSEHFSDGVYLVDSRPWPMLTWSSPQWQRRLECSATRPTSRRDTDRVPAVAPGAARPR